MILTENIFLRSYHLQFMLQLVPNFVILYKKSSFNIKTESCIQPVIQNIGSTTSKFAQNCQNPACAILSLESTHLGHLCAFAAAGLADQHHGLELLEQVQDVVAIVENRQPLPLRGYRQRVVPVVHKVGRVLCEGGSVSVQVAARFRWLREARLGIGHNAT